MTDVVSEFPLGELRYQKGEDVNTYIKRIICTAAALSLTGSAAMAASLDGYEINETAKTITLHGTIEGAKQYDDITLQLLKKDKNLSDDTVYSGNISDDFLLFTQVLADENGGYSITVNMSGEPVGFYTMRVNGEVTQKKVFYSTMAEKEKEVEQIKEIIAKDKETAVNELVDLLDLKNEYSAVAGMLNLSEETIFSTQPRGLCEVIYTILKENGVKAETIVDEINTASYIQAIREGIVDVADYAEKLKFDSLYTVAYKRLNDTNRKGFTNKYLKGKNNLTQTQLSKAYNGAVLDALCDSFGGWNDVEYFMTNLGSVAGINVGTYQSLASGKKSTFYEAALAHGSFGTVNNFKVFANSKIAELADSGIGGTGGRPTGGSGSGSGGGYTGAGIGGSKSEDSKPIAPQQEEEKPNFTDLEGYDWARESIESLAEKGIVTGVGDNTFDPGRSVTREEFLAMLMRAYSIAPDINDGLRFRDTDASAWYAGYIAVAVKKGFVTGISDTEFGIGNEITRQDAAVMAYRIAAANGKVFEGIDGAKFTDDEVIADYASDAIYAMRNAGIINGRDDNNFAPEQSCTRAEAAKIINILIK